MTRKYNRYLPKGQSIMGVLKALTAVAVSGIGAIILALGAVSTGDIGDLSTQSWLVAALAVLGSGGMVWLVENTTVAPVAKAVLAILTAGIASFVVALDDGVISQTEFLTAVSVAIVASGFVYQAPRQP